MATIEGPRLRRLLAARASTSRVSFSGARAFWIVPKLRLCPSQISPPPTSSTNGPVISRGSTWVRVCSNQRTDCSVQ